MQLKQQISFKRIFIFAVLNNQKLRDKNSLKCIYLLKIILIKIKKKLGVPMQTLALSCDILAKTQKYNDFCTGTKFELSSNYKNMFKQKTKNI